MDGPGNNYTNQKKPYSERQIPQYNMWCGGLKPEKDHNKGRRDKGDAIEYFDLTVEGTTEPTRGYRRTWKTSGR